MDKMNFPYVIIGKRLSYQMPQELDQHVAQQLCAELDRLVETHAIVELELDFAQTEFMDSSGIGVIIGRSKTMRFRGGSLVVANMGARVNMIFKAAGLDRLVTIKEGR